MLIRSAVHELLHEEQLDTYGSAYKRVWTLQLFRPRDIPVYNRHSNVMATTNRLLHDAGYSLKKYF
jgi:hypothetical protein